MVIAAIAIFAIGRIANKETNNQKKLDALTIESVSYTHLDVYKRQQSAQ